jgi:hypothetical protein
MMAPDLDLSRINVGRRLETSKNRPEKDRRIPGDSGVVNQY